jgi:hypothetical protein
MKNYWYDKAVAAIDAALEKVPAIADRRAIEGIVDAAYPFGPRENWPYQKWLEAKKNVLAVRFPKLFPKKSRRSECTAADGLFGQGK